MSVVDVIWNPQPVPTDEDVVVVRVHLHTQMPTKVLGHFETNSQLKEKEVAFGGSNFDLPIEEALRKATAYAQAHGIARLYIVDPQGLTSVGTRRT